MVDDPCSGMILELLFKLAPGLFKEGGGDFKQVETDKAFKTPLPAVLLDDDDPVPEPAVVLFPCPDPLLPDPDVLGDFNLGSFSRLVTVKYDEL
jgi:hypothetical protein